MEPHGAGNGSSNCENDTKSLEDKATKHPRLTYSGKMILAPMVKIGTTPMRLLALHYGADIVYTEEIIDWRLLRCNRVVNPVLKTIDYIDRTDDTLVLRISNEERGRLVLQMGTSDAGRAVRVAQMVVDDVDGIDINMGCPKSFSLKGGMGAALLTQPEKIKDILTSLVKAVGSRIPVTCKIRIFNDTEQTLSVVRTIVATGVEALAVHGRTKDERPNNDVHVDAIQRVVQEVAGRIPVIANGGSSNNRDSADNTNSGIKKFWKETGASSVMIARAAEWNPSVFSPDDKRATVMQVIDKYLDYAIHYDYTFVVCKYTTQQILGSLQASEMGERFLASATMRDLCAVFGRESDLEKRKAWIKAECERLGFGLLPTSCEVSMRQGTLAPSKGAVADTRARTFREIKATNLPEDEMLLKELSGTGEADSSVPEDTIVVEMNRRFIRGHYANDTQIPKARLLLLARKQKDADSKAAEWAPSYQTWSRDKSFRSVVRIDVPSSFELPHSSAKLIKPLLGDSCSENIGFVFSSLALEKNKRYAEQGSAAVAVECLLGQSITRNSKVTSSEEAEVKRQKIDSGVGVPS